MFSSRNTVNDTRSMLMKVSQDNSVFVIFKVSLGLVLTSGRWNLLNIFIEKFACIVTLSLHSAAAVSLCIISCFCNLCCYSIVTNVKDRGMETVS